MGIQKLLQTPVINISSPIVYANSQLTVVMQIKKFGELVDLVGMRREREKPWFQDLAPNI